MLDERQATILQALVEQYVQTGEPVSSRAVLETSGLHVSSATVRNDLVALEAEGYATQPHTSAGRIPTDLAYRYYVDHVSPARLRSRTRSRIEEFFASVHKELGRMLQETSDLVAEITRYPAIVAGPGALADRVHGIQLVQLGPDLVLLVLVAESGLVTKQLLGMHRPIGAPEIEAAEQLLTKVLTGRPLSEGLADLTETAEAGEVELALEIADAAAEVGWEESSHDLYFGGTSQFASLWEDLGNIQRILAFLEREATVMKLLHEGADGTTVRIGSELPVPADVDMAVVSSTYDVGEHGRGRIGVVGPKRMDYRRAISVVEQVSEELGDSLGG